MSSSTTEALVTMPQMGVSVAEGTVAVWHKQPGDWVEAEETICEISTDKIDTDVPAPAAGRVVELLVGEGETVAVGATLARIATDASPGEAHPVERGRGPVYSPVVQRIAAEHGVDLSSVSGTGRGGRVRKEDVLAAVERPLHTESPYRPTGERLSRMRLAIAEHMTRSLHTAAHCTTIVEADMSRIEAVRGRLSPLAFVARATVEALAEHPGLNATLDGELLARQEDVNLGIAVSLGERGLIVPVIHQAQDLSADGLAKRIAELADRARTDQLTADEVRGGTFTITNPGVYGSVASTPIINQPQVAILDLEAIVRRPVVVSDADGAESVGIRPVVNLCLSWDHRALDGAMAAQFLGSVRRRLENWQ